MKFKTMLSPEKIKQIEDDAAAHCKSITGNTDNRYLKDAYIAGATAEAEKVVELVEAVKNIKESPYPANERELFSWIDTCQDIATAALNNYNQKT